MAGQWKRAQRQYTCWQDDQEHTIDIGERYYAQRDHTTGEIMRFCEHCFDDQLGRTDAGEAERSRK